MGKASTNKKVARAARAAGRPGAKKSYAWPLTIGAVVVLGVLLIVLSFGGGGEARDPRIGDHWHAAYGVYDCNDFLPPLDDIGPDESGVHAHGEGLIHIHPFSTRYTGEGANLSAFGDQTGMELDDSSLKVGVVERENGDSCGDEGPGMMQLVVWDNVADEEGRLITEGIADYAPQDGEVLTIAFAPEGAEIPKPPSIINLSDPTAAEEGRTPASIPGQEAPPSPGEETPEEPGDEPAGEDGETDPTAEDTTETTAAP
jgi:hypothetical protein